MCLKAGADLRAAVCASANGENLYSRRSAEYPHIHQAVLFCCVWFEVA
jgi:hypothetical protein